METEYEEEDAGSLGGYHYFWKSVKEDSQITPQKLEHADEAPQSGNSGAGSAWNSAGTWEERSLTDWFCDRLRSQVECLRMLCYANFNSSSESVTVVPDTSATAVGSMSDSHTNDALQESHVSDSSVILRVKELERMSGDASVVSVRGKPRYGFDVSFVLKWAIVLPPSMSCTAESSSANGDEEMQKGEDAEPQSEQREMHGKVHVLDVTRENIDDGDFILEDFEVDEPHEYSSRELRLARRTVQDRLRERLLSRFKTLQNELSNHTSAR